MQHLLSTVVIILLCALSLQATTYHIDPASGDITNDGSIDAPWSTLEAVIAEGNIETYANILPYDASTNVRFLKNEGAPVKAGDTLLLYSGQHGDILLPNYNNLDYITVMAASGASPVLQRIKLQGSRKWRFDGLTISSEPYGFPELGKLIFLEDHNWQGPTRLIEIRNCDIYSATEPWTTAQEWLDMSSDGIIVKADSIELINNRLKNVNFGISARGDNINVVGNSIVNFSGDAMRILGSYILFERNYITNCYKVNDNHDDGIQSFTTNGLVVNNVTVRSNIILNYEDPDQPLLGTLQGIGLFDGPYNNWIVENNVISVNHWHGITFLGGHDCLVRNNTVLDPTPSEAPGASWIMIDDHKDGTPSSGCVVKNNVANTLIVDADESNNILLPSIADYINNFKDASNYDFHLIEGSILIDAADTETATSHDLDSIPRTFGDGPDVGAYEYDMVMTSPTINKAIAIKSFPNPVTDFLYLEGALVDYEVIVMDTKGAELHRVTQKTESVRLDLSSYQAGHYFIIFRNLKTGSSFSKIIEKVK